MAEDGLDKIHIRRLKARCIIGVYEEERREKQDVLIDMTLYADLRKACKSDRIEDTVDYKTIKKELLAMVETSEAYLVEHLAHQAAAIGLASPLVQRVVVTVDKPGALRFADSVAVEITRSRE